MPKRNKRSRAQQLADKYAEEKKQRTKKKEKWEMNTNRELERSASLSRRELRWRQQQFLDYRSSVAASEWNLVALRRTRSWSPVEAEYQPRVSQPAAQHYEGKSKKEPFAFKPNPIGQERKK